MEVDESINNDESQQQNVYGSLIDGVQSPPDVCAKLQNVLHSHCMYELH